MSTPVASGASPRSGIHPGVIVGAIAVVVFGAAGAASYLGLLPGQAASAPATPMSMAKPAQQAGLVPDAVVAPAPVAASTPAAPPPAPLAAAPAPVAAVPAPQPAPVRTQPAAPAPAKPAVAKPSPTPARAVARPAPATPSYAASAPAYTPSAPPPVAVASEPAPAPKICRDCGTVSEIIPIEKKGESSGAGAVLGGIVGGVLGHQVGGGRGKDVATVAGALGGAFLGNEIERNKASVAQWDVRVRLEDGTNKVVRYGTEPSWRVGDKVRIENGKIVSAARP